MLLFFKTLFFREVLALEQNQEGSTEIFHRSSPSTYTQPPHYKLHSPEWITFYQG